MAYTGRGSLNLLIKADNKVEKRTDLKCNNESIRKEKGRVFPQDNVCSAATGTLDLGMQNTRAEGDSHDDREGLARCPQ